LAQTILRTHFTKKIKKIIPNIITTRRIYDVIVTSLD